MYTIVRVRIYKQCKIKILLLKKSEEKKNANSLIHFFYVCVERSCNFRKPLFKWENMVGIIHQLLRELGNSSTFIQTIVFTKCHYYFPFILQFAWHIIKIMKLESNGRF